MRWIGPVWGLLGVTALLGWAIYRLGLIGLEGLAVAWDPLHWAVFALWLAVTAVGKGHFALRRGWSPRIAARVRHLHDHPAVIRTLLAPLFCLGFFHAPRKRIIISTVMVIVMIGLVIAVQGLVQPWRGIVDLGVAVGLAWGLVSLWQFTLQAWSPAGLDHSPEVPGEEGPAATG